jgi:vacuolar-type H+-ATPase subunit C/Vma6
MELTDAQRKKIWLVSDTVLYPEAVTFVREVAEDEDVRELPKTAQIMGLLNIIKSSRYDDVVKYINHQIERNVDRVFYEKLRQVLSAMQRTRMQEEFQLVTAQATKREEDAEKKELLLLLTREFIQHVVTAGKKRSESYG